MGCGRDGVGADDEYVLVADFEAFELFQGGVEGAASGVDPVLKPGEGLIASLEGIGGGVGVPRAGAEELVPKGILDPGEAAKVPLAVDDLVEETSRLGGGGGVGGGGFVLWARCSF